MQETIFRFFLLGTFSIALLKGALKGAIGELISLFFSLLAFCSFLYVHKITKHVVISSLIFIIIYNIGLYLAYIKRRGGFLQVIFGVLIGMCKFFVFLAILTAIADIMEIITPKFKENEMVKLIFPYVQTIKDFILRFYK